MDLNTVSHSKTKTVNHNHMAGYPQKANFDDLWQFIVDLYFSKEIWSYLNSTPRQSSKRYEFQLQLAPKYLQLIVQDGLKIVQIAYIFTILFTALFCGYIYIDTTDWSEKLSSFIDLMLYFRLLSPQLKTFF